MFPVFLCIYRMSVATNVYLLSPCNTNFLYIFYIVPCLLAGVVTLLCVGIATWKLNLRRCKCRKDQERGNRVRREMTATIRLVGLVYLVCNTGYPAFLIYLSSSSRAQGLLDMRLALLSRPEHIWLAYILGNVLCFVDAAATPVILSFRGSQLKEAHRENLQRAISRLSRSRSCLTIPVPDGLDKSTLQFLAASSMQLSSLGLETVTSDMRFNMRRKVQERRRSVQGKRRLSNGGHSSRRYTLGSLIRLPVLSEEPFSSGTLETVACTSLDVVAYTAADCVIPTLEL